MYYITYPQPNGNVALVTPSMNVDINRVIKKSVPEGSEYKIVESIEIDHVFFGAYEFDAELGAKLNIDKAKDIHLDKFRSARTPLLASLDVDFMRAVESGNTALQKEIAAKKQALRDVTNTELPNTLEEIKATWPEILGPKI